MRGLLLALVLAVALVICGCSPAPAAVPLDMADQQQAASKPPSVRTVTSGCASIEVPDDWDVMDDLGIDATLVYPPYHASGDVSGWDDDDETARQTILDGHDSLMYELERDGTEVLRDVCEDDGETVRRSVVYVGESDGTTYEYWENVIYSDGHEARFIGSVDASCTDAQKAEFAWVADSLRLVSSKSE